MRRVMAVVLLVAVLCSISFTSDEEEKEGVGIPSVFITKITTNPDVLGDVKAIVKVADEKNKPISGLKGENFTANDGKEFSGGEITVSEIEPGEFETAYVLLIDVSGSMASEGKIDKAKDACGYFIDKIADKDQVAIITFEEEIRSLGGFTNDKKELKKRIEVITTQRKWTRLYDAIHKGGQMLIDIEADKKVMIVLTDGKDALELGNPDDGSRIPFDACLPPLYFNHIQLYTIALGGDADKNKLERFAMETGGEYYYAKKAEELKDVYEDICKHLSKTGFYQIGYTIPKSYLKDIKKGDERNLEVLVKYKDVPNKTSRSYEVPVEEWRKLLIEKHDKQKLILTISAFVGAIVVIILLVSVARRKPRRYVRKQVVEQEGVKTPEEPELKEKEIGKGFDFKKVEEDIKVTTGAVTETVVEKTNIDNFAITGELKKGNPIAYLRVLKHPETEYDLENNLYPITKKTATIGRSEDCEILLGGDDYVSRRHAEVRYEQLHFVIEDMGSKNGTRIYNKTREKFEKVGKVEIVPGSYIAIGKYYIFRFELPREVTVSGRTRMM